MRNPKSVEDLDCVPTNGSDYTGTTNTTESGWPCQKWSETPEFRGVRHVGEHNYCRGDYPVFCFSTDPDRDKIFGKTEYCEVPLCDTHQQSPEEKGCLPTDGTSYIGKANTTRSGRKCQMWSVDTPHEHDFNDIGKHNYCIFSPKSDFRADDRVFCYTTDPKDEWDYCDVPLCVTTHTQSTEEIGCKPTDGRTPYTGQANTTVSGRVCQKWSVNTPHDSPYPEVGEHNYCRSPDGDVHGLWCYTIDPRKGWEYCDVPDCETQEKAVFKANCIPLDGTAYSGTINTTVSGRTCMMWSDTSYVGEHNYCKEKKRRNSYYYWCLTTDPKVLWEDPIINK